MDTSYFLLFNTNKDEIATEFKMRRSSMKKILILALLLMIHFLGIVTAEAANHYVLAGASGTGNDWTDACPDFTGSCAPASMVRGDT